MANTLADQISLDRVQDHYVSRNPPQRLSNLAPIGYGGYAIGLAIRTAYHCCPDGYNLYSAAGHYLRAARTDLKMICTPVQTRKSKSFMTYRVVVEQNDPSNGKLLRCMEILADFHKAEPSILTYSAPPSRSYSRWQDCVPWEHVVDDQWFESGKITAEERKIFNKQFGLSLELFDNRPCPEGISSQNLLGLAKNTKTSQDELPPAQKSSADWLKAKHPLQTKAEQVAGLGFTMDNIIGFSPLSHNHMFLNDAAVCSTLDFALRVFVPHPKMDEWHLREVINHQAGHGLTYSEGKLWDEAGNLVASMTQQSILRAPAKNQKLWNQALAL